MVGPVVVLFNGPAWHTSCHLLFFCQRPLPFGGSHLRLPSGPAGIRTATGSLSALARPTPYQLSHRVAYTQVVICMRRDDTVLSSLAPIDLFSSINWHCHVTAWWFVFVGFLCVLFFVFLFLVLFLVLVLCASFLILMNVTVQRTMYRSSTSLLLRPLQLGPLRDLINQLIPFATCFETC